MSYPNTLALDLITVLRWAARAMSAISIGIVALFFIGEGFNPTKISLQEWALFLCFPFTVVVGLMMAWRNEWLGGTIAIGGLLSFYLVHALVANGHLPTGWAFGAFTSPALLFLLYAVLARATKPR
ncbi:MAG: hypothetical protein JNM09_01225 [Blastocatellia bacterium]|nr:hypothetical protein [Blastocatellia bacterium]